MPLATRITDLAAAIRDKINLMVPRLLPTGGTAGQVVQKTGPAVGAVAWATPATGGGGAAATEIEINFGAVPVTSKVFTITDATVTATSKITASQSGKAATGRAADENQWTALVCNATPQAGQFLLSVFCVNGRAIGPYKIIYTVGV